MKKIYIIRHGRTFLNKYDKMQGWCDSPLTKDGLAGAQEVAQVLRDVDFGAAFSSDLKRASDTAKIILQANKNAATLELVESPHFREAFYGYFEGMGSPEAWFLAGMPHGFKNKAEIINQNNYDVAKDFMKEADPFHDAENAAEYWARVDQGLELIKALPDSVENVLLVTHSNTISSIAERFSQPGEFALARGARNSSISILELAHDKFKLVSFNKLTL
ncbi:phosphoglycerate mutase [Amylolactobacillus amylotrophicus DSM 20534]|uniref:Histidine phosphatase family protein n=3 Tax=Amylolactobacillus TaxID=2767876 RepID=A0A1L6XCP7_9LACO|nr:MULTISPECIES: histidine phosphatase family protein [Amylolactobacillus]APT18742.1 histidine phosphatase family protein [Amylolactobacillus amylophilus DSM 20533 = JCM 1125]KRK37019.1 phosphoglycerate mutase [Amylolactobacillus amylotrophicus DSM 20534]KRM41468.1 phosphoglycerate mutase [Amylolactobacillus amylophilus DSM 20533 = JCM 1125]GED80658.1 phosphoglycerate mutase [Amylolactobacillus amylophilus]